METEVKVADFTVLQLASEPPRRSYATEMIAPQLIKETRGAGIKIAVIDTGVDLNHPDLKHVRALDFTGEGPHDGNGHGTWCCGAVGANGKMIGIAPEAEIYSLKALKNNGTGNTGDIIKAWIWCLANGMDIVSMSFGGGKPSDPQYTKALKDLWECGAYLVAAAGNWGAEFPQHDTVGYPAALAEVIAVAAVDVTKQRGGFSSMGPDVELAAAGVEVWGCWTGGKYARISGTSMACPALAAAAALCQGRAKFRLGQKLSPDALRTHMQLEAEDRGIVGRDREYGFGVFSFARFTEDGQLGPDAPPREIKVNTATGEFFADGEKHQMDVPPILVRGRTMAEIRGLANTLGYKQILWEPPYAIFRNT